MKVPFLDLAAHHAPIRKEVDRAIAAVIDRNAFAGGPFVEQFEKEFAAFCDVSDAVGVGNGTDALWFALLAAGVTAGDEVITVPNTFIATAEAISFCGATPVFVDIDETTYNLDPRLLEAAINERTKAIVPVHLFGQTADMNPILEIAAKHNLPVIEDACQAHGAEYEGRKAGSMGLAGCFSFYPGKNLGAFGEAGGIVTNDPDMARKMRILRDHGQPRKYEHSVIGWNGRMDGIQAAVLSVKLRGLQAANDARRRNAELYARYLPSNDGLLLPVEAGYARHIYHVYAVRTPRRDALMQHLQRNDIGCGVHYPIPLHRQEAYALLGKPAGSYPVAERCAGEFLSLPMYPELTEEQIEHVAATLATA